MLNIKTFILNPFQENTHLVFDETSEAVIIDPGCSSEREFNTVNSYIKDNDLKLKKVLNTHLHIDHVLGNGYFAEAYGLKPTAHYNDLDMYFKAKDQAIMFGLKMDQEMPSVETFLDEGDSISFGNTHFSILHIPGHSPGSICFYSKLDKVLFAGDALFNGSIGRTDLWGGNHDLLIGQIKEKLLTLPDDTLVYPGHGPTTTIGDEKEGNPYL